MKTSWRGASGITAACISSALPTSMRRTPRGVARPDRTGDQRHRRAGLGRGTREREAHLAARPVGQAAHRIDRLEGRAGGDQHGAALQHLRLEERDQLGEQLLGLEHPAVADLAAGLVAARRAEHDRRRRRAAARHCAASPDAPTSRGSSPARAAAGSARSAAPGTCRLSRSSARPCASWAIRSALAGAISTASAARVRLMCAMLFGSRASHCDVTTGTARQRLHRHRGDEVLGRLGHHDLHGGAGLRQLADQLGRLVAGDPAREAEHHMPAGQVERSRARHGIAHRMHPCKTEGRCGWIGGPRHARHAAQPVISRAVIVYLKLSGSRAS